MRSRHLLLSPRIAAVLVLGILLVGCHHDAGANFNSMSPDAQKKAFTNAVPMTPDLMQRNAARQNAIGMARMGAHTPPASPGASTPPAH
jgi:hypothetical protein